MRYYPAFLDLKNRPCLVIGGGQVGERKVKTLQSCGARVYLISRELSPYLKDEVEQDRINLLAPSYDAKYLEDMFLVIGATDDPDLNKKISREALEHRLLCNIADDPEACNFILPSLVSRGDLTIAISTAGKSPALAKKIRRDLEDRFPEIYGRYLELLGQIRTLVLARKKPQEENQKIFEALINAPWISWVEEGDFVPFYDLLDRLIDPPLPRSVLTETMNQLFHRHP